MAIITTSWYAQVPVGLVTNIPTSLSDPRFASNTVGPADNFPANGIISNKTWNENPTYPDGNQNITWSGNTSSDVLTLSQCAVDWREGPRVAGLGGGASALVLDQCFVNCIGFNGDHADAIQSFAGTGMRGNLTLTNTCLRSYGAAEAAALYAPVADGSPVGSDGLFWADDSEGTIKFRNVLIWGGTRGVTATADAGVVNIDFDSVYFASSPNNAAWEGWAYSINAAGGTLNVTRWTNVFRATIVGGIIIPGASIPAPPGTFS